MGPFRVVGVTGLYRQRVTIEPIHGPGRRLTVHAGQLVPSLDPYPEADLMPDDFLPEDDPGRLPPEKRRRPPLPLEECPALAPKRPVGRPRRRK